MDKIEEFELNEDVQIKNNTDLNACVNLRGGPSGDVIKLGQDKALIRFTPTESMVMDKTKMIHSGFLYNSASFAALCAINRVNAVIISSEVNFLSPIELGHEIIFDATSLLGEARRSEVKVEGFLLDIKILDATFNIVVLDKQVFRVNKNNI